MGRARHSVRAAARHSKSGAHGATPCRQVGEIIAWLRVYSLEAFALRLPLALPVLLSLILSAWWLG